MKKFIILILSLSIISCFCSQPLLAFAENSETSNEISDVNHDITIKSDIVVNSCSFTTSKNDEICLNINFSDGEKNYFENLRFSLIYDSPFPDSVPRYVGDFKSGTKDVMFFQVLNKPDSLYLHEEITSEAPIFEIVIADQKEYCVFDIKYTISSEVYNFLANSAMNIDDFSSESERIGKVNQINCDPCWKETLELVQWFADNPHAFDNINDEICVDLTKQDTSNTNDDVTCFTTNSYSNHIRNSNDELSFNESSNCNDTSCNDTSCNDTSCNDTSDDRFVDNSTSNDNSIFSTISNLVTTVINFIKSIIN